MKRAAVGAALFFFFFAGPECKTVLAGTEGVKAREEDQSEELKKELTAELDFSEIRPYDPGPGCGKTGISF